jgi:hypothetical protein
MLALLPAAQQHDMLCNGGARVSRTALPALLCSALQVLKYRVETGESCLTAGSDQHIKHFWLQLWLVTGSCGEDHPGRRLASCMF